ncbi:sulfate transporter [Nocardia sp. NPDC058058]|uniref:sulfate transporter n=1 Tax=Nocardia sp. NPDC058058 TaxID=3346317 RepID=UPI0036DAD0D4
MTDAEGCFLMRPQGELTASTYRDCADNLVRFAMDEPRALIVVLDGLRVASPALYTAFTSARLRVHEWPGVPIVLVIQEQARRDRPRTSVERRWIPLYASVFDALRGLGEQPARQRAALDLAPLEDCARFAVRFVDMTCSRWAIPDLCAPARLVVTELVENSLRHSRVNGDLRVRLELRGGLFTIAVGDDDPREAVLREPGAHPSPHTGLHMVAGLARAWGCTPQWPKGKVVWAVLGARRAG